jgi:Leucine-rich repeat (LRR) protein
LAERAAGLQMAGTDQFRVQLQRRLENEFTGEEDFGLFSQLPELRALNLRHTGIRDVRFLKSLGQLCSLSIGKNGFTDLSIIATLRNLRYLNIEDSSIENIEPLKSLSFLEDLVLSHNLIKDVRPLSNLTQLTSLELSHNHIYRLDGLKSLTRLKELYLDHNRFRDLDDLYYLPELEELTLNDNKIEYLHPDLLRCVPYLKRITVHNNRINGLPEHAMKPEKNCLESLKTHFGLPLNMATPPAPAPPATSIANSSSVETKSTASQTNYAGCLIFLLWIVGTSFFSGLISHNDPGGYVIGAVIGFFLAAGNAPGSPFRRRRRW